MHASNLLGLTEVDGCLRGEGVTAETRHDLPSGRAGAPGLYLTLAVLIHRRGPWRSFEAVEFATLIWVDSFNNRRLLEAIGNIPPAESEERYYIMFDEGSWRRMLIGRHAIAAVDLAMNWPVVCRFTARQDWSVAFVT